MYSRLIPLVLALIFVAGVVIRRQHNSRLLRLSGSRTLDRIFNEDLLSSREVTTSSNGTLVSNWVDVNRAADLNSFERCHHFRAGPATATYPQVLKKTVFSNKARFTFIVGLEGSGHHLFHTLLNSASTARCPPSIDGFTLNSDENNHGLSGVGSDEAEMVDLVNSFNHSISNFNTNDKDGSLKPYFLNTMCESWGKGMMSYPNYGGNCRRYKFVDVRIMAEMFESAGLDFRVVVLTRDVLDILVSTALHRRMINWKTAVKRYRDILNHDIIENQLMRINPDFVRCVDYDSLPDLPPGLGTFLGLDTDAYQLDNAMKALYERSVSESERLEEQLEFKKLDVNKEHLKLQEANNRLKKLCADIMARAKDSD